jgi:hypothetical protein
MRLLERSIIGLSPGRKPAMDTQTPIIEIGRRGSKGWAHVPAQKREGRLISD